MRTVQRETRSPVFLQALNVVIAIATVLAIVLLIVDLGGFELSESARRDLAILDWIVLVIFISESFIKWGYRRFSLVYLKGNWPDFALISLFLVVLLIVLVYTPASFQSGWLPLLVDLRIARVYMMLVRLYLVGSPLFRGARRFARARLAPAQIVVLSFLFVILMGASLLLLPGAVVPPERINPIDALFTATSATCVTGLIVVDTGSYFTRFGQMVILFLIQIGGLGLMTITTFFFLLLGRDMSIRENILMRHALNVTVPSRVPGLIMSVLALTIIIEALGASFLYISWSDFGVFEQGSVLYYSIFHSVSAFCNAGFSLFEDSFSGFRDNLLLNMTITSLIISGGLGFTVIMNILSSIIFRKERLSLHAKLVLTVTAVLIAGGTLFILMTEWNNSLAELPFLSKLMASYFQSVTPRTAGFNTINIGSLTYACQFLMMLLMFIGASPGGTGGGIKTSTFGIFLGSVWSMLKGRNSVEIFKRSVPRDVVNNALLLPILALMLISGFGFILLLTQEGDPIHILFELFSAFGTVGLSAGITPNLTTLGKIVIIMTMFIGRVGPLTLMIALRRQREGATYEYPEEPVMVG